MTMIGDENEEEIMQAIIDAMEETTEEEWEAIIDRLRESVAEKVTPHPIDERPCDQWALSVGHFLSQLLAQIVADSECNILAHEFRISDLQ